MVLADDVVEGIAVVDLLPEQLDCRQVAKCLDAADHISFLIFQHRRADADRYLLALAVEDVGESSFKVSGRGVLHLAVLIENMRREGYELTISRPHVIVQIHEGIRHEPIETLVVDTTDATTGPIIELVGKRQGMMTHMHSNNGRTLMEFAIPTRGLIGLRTKAITATSGEAIFNHRFLEYAPMKNDIPQRINGVLLSMESGKSAAYALDALRDRGFFFVDPGEWCYEGMIVGEHCKDNDLVVNVQKGKKMTNMRASGSDRKLQVSPATRLSLEEALEYINDDELVEATPDALRLRKYFLNETERKRKRDFDWTRVG